MHRFRNTVGKIGLHALVPPQNLIRTNLPVIARR
jgi:hypothetical protein